MSEEQFRKYEDLADGTMLLQLKKDYLKERNDQALISLLSCLRESFVSIPATVTMSERDERRLHEAARMHTLDSFKAKDEMRMRPEIITAGDGRRFFPMFTRPDEIPEKFKGNFSVFEEAVPNCVALAKAMSGLNGLVLDPFTEPLMILFDMAEMILKAPRLHG